MATPTRPPVETAAHDVDHALIIVDGATAEAVSGGGGVAMDAGVLESTSIGDTTEDTVGLKDSAAGEQTTPEFTEGADSRAHEVEPPALDFEWGIVVGKLTDDDFMEILSLPKL